MNTNPTPPPTSWADVTLAQFLALVTPAEAAQPGNGEQGGTAAQMLAMFDEQVLAKLLPTPGLLEIGLSAYGLYEQAERHLATIPDAHPLAHGAYLYALYRAPTGPKADEQALAAAYTAVLGRPLVEVYADCLYFLASYRRAGSGAPAVGVAQAGVLRIQLPTAPVPQGLRARLGNLWNTNHHAQA